MIAQEERFGGRDFAVFDGKKIAVVLKIASDLQVLQGWGSYELHSTLGAVLRVQIQTKKRFERQDLLIAETLWSGVIQAGTDNGCDVCFIPADDWRPQ